jgi:hypothetical protein
VLIAFAAVAWPAVEATAADGFEVSVGAEFSSGEYGGDQTVEEWYVPLTGWYRADRYSLQVTVPYLRVDAPEGTIIEGPGGQPIPGDGPNVTESGLGDVVLGLTLHDVWTAMDDSLALDVGSRVKLGTADEDKGLGTGKTDVTLQADLIRFLPGFTAIGSAGYVLRGDPDDFDLDDGFLASLGGVFRASPVVRVGAFIEYRQASYEFNDDVVELIGSLGWKMGGWRMFLSANAGLSDSAPDWGVGISCIPGR